LTFILGGTFPLAILSLLFDWICPDFLVRNHDITFGKLVQMALQKDFDRHASGLAV
jgi:hypothetical protein